MEKIDLTGFIREDIELVIDDMTFRISTDPDVESWVFLLNFINGKFNPEEYVDAQRKLLISLIVNSNKDVDIAKLKDKLGPTALEQFIKPYVEILIKKGILKRLTEKDIKKKIEKQSS